MKLGLITDIHEDVPRLAAALQLLRREAVDQIVLIGDVASLFKRLTETCQLLLEAQVIGVWGNHDLGFCNDPEPDVVERYPPSVRQFMSRLKPTLTLGECHFSHVEPWLDPTDPAEINYYEGPPDDSAKLSRIFQAVPQRLLFVGHYHEWQIATPDRLWTWRGEGSVSLAGGRHFCVIGALCEGHLATFDTETSLLVPWSIRFS